MLRRPARVLLALPLVAVAMLVPRVDAAREASQFTVNVTIEPGTLLFYNLAYLSVHTRIGATCGARVIYSGGGAPADGMDKSAHVGRTGIVGWSFTVGAKATKGTATVTCIWKGQTRRGKAGFRVTAPPATPTPEPIATPPPAVNPTFQQVNDHPSDWFQKSVSWTCVLYKFLDDPSYPGNTTIGCIQFVLDRYHPEGYVVLSVPPTIISSNVYLLDGYILRVNGTVDVPWQGLSDYGSQVTHPRIQVTSISSTPPQ